ncbi:MAG TPA: SPOR domain-containing protein [Candidatus Polarisedimenticolia bacterium]|nr:SPOR domain-containing protein [Candidatus Polarisedimenticolia bacterium]
MARGIGQRGSGERVLESRHLVGLFLGVVLLCGVFFTLGYVMGKTQYGAAVHAASSADRNAPLARSAAKPKDLESPPAPAAAPANSEWDFYTKKSNNHLEPTRIASAPAASRAVAASAVKPSSASRAMEGPASSRFRPPKMLKGAVVLQVAALKHQSDALAMADMLQQKKFPSFVVTPATDSFYHVQVGPYPDEHAAESAKSALNRAGFKAIVKR